MKKQFGDNMNNIDKDNRKTEIIDDIQDEIFAILKDALLKESRLLKRYYEFCLEYNSFEFDELGINMEDSELVLNKIDKIRDKLLFNISESTKYKLLNIKNDEVYYKILFDIIIDGVYKHFIVEVDIDSFDLEVY
ncbi:hypothetical protein MNB_ARC-1_751 [hydrothermal vent metagenome]|uniref:Uncharacterized protein n=1 Tax=hydrothermal vent metagenome TaxID=652676 RepID=A0A3B1E6W3_9ZZZZ